MIAAWVDGEPVPAADVEAEVDRLRAGPLADRLPPAGTADARQLRRWVTQRIVLGRLLEHEAAARGLTPARGPSGRMPRWSARPPPTYSPPRPRPAPCSRPSPPTRPRRRSGPTTPPTPTGTPAANAGWPGRRSRRPRAGCCSARRPSWTRRRWSPSCAAARPGRSTVDSAGTGWWSTRSGRPARSRTSRCERSIEAELTGRATQLAFARWLDEAAAGRIRLAPGFEHPADPRQPDATHRH